MKREIKRPPRVFVKKGKLYVRIGGQNFLIKDQDEYTKRELMDVIINDLVVRRKRRSRGRMTRRERRLNKNDLRTFEEFARINRNQTKYLRLPTNFIQDTSSPQTFFNALEKAFKAVPRDVNIDTRKAIEAPRKSVERKAIEAAKKNNVPGSPLAIMPALPQQAIMPNSPRRSISPPPPQPPKTREEKNITVKVSLPQVQANYLQKAEDNKAATRDRLRPLIKDLGIKISGNASSVKMMESVLDHHGDDVLELQKNLSAVGIPDIGKVDPIPRPPSAFSGAPPPPPGVPPIRAVQSKEGDPSKEGGPPPPGGPPKPGPPPKKKGLTDFPLESFNFGTTEAELAGDDKTLYTNTKKKIINSFTGNKLVPKRKTLERLIASEKLPIDLEYPRKKVGSQMQFTGNKSVEDLSKNILEYYEKQNKRVEIPTIINKYFPEGIENVVTTPSKPLPKIVIAATKGLDMVEELKQRQASNKLKATTGESISDKLAREKKEKEEYDAASFLKTIKLKQLPKKMEEKEKEEKEDEVDEVPELEYVRDSDGAPEVDSKTDLARRAMSEVIEAVSEQTGPGKKYTGKGLSTSEIDNMMGVFGRQYLGTLPADFLKHLPATLPRRFGFVMNLDKADKPGSHWVAVLVDAKHDMSVEYFDSFAQEPSKDFLRDIKKIIDRMNVNLYLKLKINKIVEQDSSTANCGWFAMNFLSRRFGYKPFREITKYDDSKNGEKNISSLKNKFGYI